MNDQLYQIGDTVKAKDGTLECVSVGYVEKPEGNDYMYTFRLKDAITAEKKAADEAEKERVKQVKADRKKLERENAESRKTK